MKSVSLSSAEAGVARKLLAITLFVMALLVVWQMFMQRFFLDRVREIYEGNMAYVLEDLVRDLKQAFSFQGTAVGSIAGDQDVKEYAAMNDTPERYTKAYGTVRPMIMTATVNSLVDSLVIYDHTRAWYQFSGTLSTKALRTLRETYWGMDAEKNEVIELDGATYLCSAAPIVQFQNNSRFMNVGMAAALTNIERFRGSLSAFDLLEAGTILIHDGEKVLLSSDAALEGAALSGIDRSPSRYYLLNEDVLKDVIKVMVLMPRESIFPTRMTFWLMIVSASVFVMTLFLVLSLMVNRWLVRPYRRIMSGIHSLGQKGLSGRLQKTGIKHMDSLTDSINDTLSRLEDATARAMEAQQAAYETRLARQRIEMVLLHKQIDTHFFYNSLISIKYLSDQGDNQKAGEMAQGVAALLRYVHSTAQRLPIFDEMSAIQRYTQIMNIRFNDKFTVDFDVDDRLSDYMMPRMLLQPLVENAMMHGLESKEGPCLLEIRGRMEAGAVILAVWDNGVGIAQAKLAAFRRRMEEDIDAYEYLNIKGISLINIHKRIRKAFGPEYGLSIDSLENEYTLATIRIPMIHIN